MYQDPMKRKAMPVRTPQYGQTIQPPQPTMPAPAPVATVRAPLPVPTTPAYPPKTPGMVPTHPGVQQQSPNGARDMAQQMLNSGGTYKPTAPQMGGRAQAIRQQQQDAIRERELARLRQIMGRG